MDEKLFTYSDSLRNKICRFATSILGNEEDARDVVQEVFTRLWIKRFLFAKYRNKEALSFKLTRDLCYDRLKHKKVISENSKLMVDEATFTDIRYETEIKDLGEITKRLIAQLPEKQRMIINLRDIEEMEFEEISQIMDMDINAIRMNLSRARTTVREKILKITDYGIR